jgi:hypothetical protein
MKNIKRFKAFENLNFTERYNLLSDVEFDLEDIFIDLKDKDIYIGTKKYLYQDDNYTGISVVIGDISDFYQKYKWSDVKYYIFRSIKYIQEKNFKLKELEIINNLYAYDDLSNKEYKNNYKSFDSLEKIDDDKEIKSLFILFYYDN